jgi:purine/pyrimidine-nucleoside phosphorylase
MSPTRTFEAVTLTTQANVYFDGKCISHNFVTADGARKSAGVILPASLTFTTGAAEVMESLAGACEVLLPGETAWKRVEAGESFSVPEKSSFQIRVTGEPYHYLCHFG